MRCDKTGKRIRGTLSRRVRHLLFHGCNPQETPVEQG